MTDTCKPIYILGRRGSGKSTMIDTFVSSVKATVVVETENDYDHHTHIGVLKLPTIHKTVRRDDVIETKSEWMHGYDAIALDNVIFDTKDVLLDEAILYCHKNGVRLIVTVSHPSSIPIGGYGIIVQLSNYTDLTGMQCLRILKATYKFQLAANTFLHGNT